MAPRTFAILAVLSLLFVSAPAIEGRMQVSRTLLANPNPGATFDHFFIIVLENTNYADALLQPYMKNLTTHVNPNGRLLSNYYAVKHPSEPNYVAMISGSTNKVTTDKPYDLPDPCIVDQFEARGITWKAYQENYPGNCFLGDSSPYVRKHNPFISFTSISGDPARCAKIVDASQLDVDIANKALPQFSFYTPNMNNDGHDTNSSYADTWLQTFLEPKLSNKNFMSKTAVVVIFDENEGPPTPNQVYAALVGDVVTSNVADSTPYTHYSLMATVEKNWGLSPIVAEGDGSANPFVF